MLRQIERHVVEIDLQRGDLEIADEVLIVANLIADIGRRADPRRALFDLAFERFLRQSGDDFVVAGIIV